jgi:hypothetical protein
MSLGGGGISGKEAPSLSVPYRYIVSATIALAVFTVLLPFERNTLVGLFIAPRMLFMLHLATLGWVTMTVIGASLQLVPVALQVRVSSERLAGWVFYLFLPGLLLLLYGFWTSGSSWLMAGGVVIALAATLYLVVMIGTVMSSTPVESLVATHVVAAFAAFLWLVLMGVLLVFNRHYGFLHGSHIPSLGGHGALGLAGFFSILAYGVGYKLIGMFTLAEDRINHRVAYTQLALTCLGLVLLGAISVAGGSAPVAAVAVAAILVGAVLFAWQIVMLYLQRRRRMPDIVYPFALSGVVIWVVALAMAEAGIIAGLEANHWIWRTALWLGLFGWIGMMILGHMYKINTFLAWLHKYADLVGKKPVPKLDSLYEPGLGKVGWAVYGVGVLVVAAGMIAGSSVIVLVGSLVFAVGVLIYLINMALIFKR